MALALAVFATGTLLISYQRQIVESDDDIDSETKEVKAQLLLTGKQPEAVAWDLDPHMGWMVFDDQGRVLRTDPIVPEEAARPALGATGIISTGTLFRGWRVSAFQAAPNRTIVVGYEMTKVYGVLGDLVIAYTWSLPLVVIVVVVGSWWVTGRALAPFRALADSIEGIESENLECRVPEPRAKDEIHRLTVSFNALLVRIGRSFAQTKRFAADASHELRTPLTIMRGELELMVRDPEVAPAQQRKLASVQEEIARLDRITEQLLLLARFDAGQVRIEKSQLDFSLLVGEVCEHAELLTQAAGVTLATNIHPGLQVKGDAHHLRRLVLNLLDNACKYNESGGRVQCSITAEPGFAVLTIGNAGPGIPAEMRDRVFERFFRADASRPSTRGHGLGLALCKEIASFHGGTLTLGACGNGWTEFSVRLPTLSDEETRTGSTPHSRGTAERLSA